jgi:tRNA A37 threonylcarbamoyladenosine synthetase subunit TsaC/SUA5/YrdC
MEMQQTQDERTFASEAAPSETEPPSEVESLEAFVEGQDRERRRVEFKASLDEARALMARGEVLAITRETVWKLAAQVNARARERLRGPKAAPQH